MSDFDGKQASEYDALFESFDGLRCPCPAHIDVTFTVTLGEMPGIFFRANGSSPGNASMYEFTATGLNDTFTYDLDGDCEYDFYGRFTGLYQRTPTTENGTWLTANEWLVPIWESGQSYSIGDVVWSSASLAMGMFASTTNHTSSSGNQPPSSPTWQRIWLWRDDIGYVADDLVYWTDGKVHKCLAPHTNQEPPNVTYWSDFFSMTSAGTATWDRLELGSASSPTVFWCKPELLVSGSLYQSSGLLIEPPAVNFALQLPATPPLVSSKTVTSPVYMQDLGDWVDVELFTLSANYRPYD